MSDSNARPYGGAEEFLRIRAIGQTHLEVVPVIADPLDERQLPQEVGVSVHAERHLLAAGRCLDLDHTAVEYLARPRDHANPVAQALGVLDEVCREEDGRPLSRSLQNDLLEEVDIEGVEAAERLVEDQELRPVKHGGKELDLLLHALGQRLDGVIRPVDQLHALEPTLRLAARRVSAHSLEHAEEGQVFGHSHLLVQSTFLGQVADPLADRVVHRGSEQLDLAAVRSDDVEHDPDGGCLPGPVGSEQSVDRTSRHVEIQLVDGRLCAERLAHTLESDRHLGHGNLGEDGRKSRGCRCSRQRSLAYIKSLRHISVRGSVFAPVRRRPVRAPRYKRTSPGEGRWPSIV